MVINIIERLARKVNIDNLVSAIIITHNRKDLLPRAVQSVMSQSYEHVEIIIVDDGSTDGTKEIVKEMIRDGADITYLRHDIPKGACAARNYGISQAKGTFIAGLDDDDEWTGRRVELMLAAYKPKYSFICASDASISKKGRARVKRSGVIILNDILFENVVGNQILTTKDKIMSIGGFDESMPAAQDYDTWIRLIEAHGSALAIPEVLQEMYLSDTIPRITTSSSKFKGYLKCHFKHKHLMSRAHRRFQLFILYKCRNKKMTVRTFCILFDFHKPVFKLYDFLNVRLSKLI
jgi:glycosyltransferase involved in cell wall biosynthesis